MATTYSTVNNLPYMIPVFRISVLAEFFFYFPKHNTARITEFTAAISMLLSSSIILMT